MSDVYSARTKAEESDWPKKMKCGDAPVGCCIYNTPYTWASIAPGAIPYWRTNGTVGYHTATCPTQACPCSRGMTCTAKCCPEPCVNQPPQDTAKLPCPVCKTEYVERSSRRLTDYDLDTYIHSDGAECAIARTEDAK